VVLIIYLMQVGFPRSARQLAVSRTFLRFFFSLILFSLGHLYQGWGGTLGAGFAGISLALLYALTGNLLASILWHVLFDVRFSFGVPMAAGTIPQPGDAASPHLVNGGEPVSGPDKWHRRQQRRWRLHKNWKEQPHGQEGEETIALDPSKTGAERAASESKEAAHIDASSGVPQRPARGRAAREQLWRDLGGER
jgi:hypothetical protein